MFTLKIVKGAELAEGVRAEMPLPEALSRFTVGRDPANPWPIPDKTLAISARHCEFVAAGSRVLLRDLSTNGTFVNGSAVRIAGDHVLRDGDLIAMGPYVIEVRGHGAHAASAAADDQVTLHVPRSAVEPRSPSVEDTAPIRGGDPAAMLAAGLGARPPREGLTEILMAAPPVDDADVEVTKIRMAPKAPPASAPAPATPAPAPAPAAPPVDPVTAALAQGLGLPHAALAGRSPAEAAAQVAGLARAAVFALRQVASPQDPLRAAPTPEAALQALLALGAGAAALLQRSAQEAAAPNDKRP
ncbi:MAG: FHA domain-containing protein [Rubrivivax sp.]|nr:FHA domain-containing protein [Rubrivivax sp.]